MSDSATEQAPLDVPVPPEPMARKLPPCLVMLPLPDRLTVPLELAPARPRANQSLVVKLALS